MRVAVNLRRWHIHMHRLFVGWHDGRRHNERDDVGDDEPLVSIATEPPPSTTPAAPPEPAPAASKKSGKSGKSGKKPKTKRWRDADVDDDMDAAAVQARERARAQPSGAAPRPAARLLLRPLSLHANRAPSCCPASRRSSTRS